MSKREYAFQKTIFVMCSECNENIVERADERDITTMAKAREYAREHEEQHRYDDRHEARNG